LPQKIVTARLVPGESGDFEASIGRTPFREVMVMAAKKKAPKSKQAHKSKAGTSAKQRAGKQKTSGKRWVKDVHTVSTFPPKDLFTKNAKSIARGLASKKVSPKGVGSGIRMLQYFINRGGKGLSASRKRELERAKKILHEKLEQEHAEKAKPH
jgi:tRNA(adenine34) deaminase